MNRFAMWRLVLIYLIGLATGCANRSNQSPTDINEPPQPVLVHASGVQIYVLAMGPDGHPTWKLKAPDATFSGKALEGKHYAGPTWECTADGSKVVGEKISEQPSPDPNAVPWLLLKAKSHEGSGVFSHVTFIRRINTSGGKAPATTGAKVGDEVRVPYSADYVFYSDNAITRP